MQTMAVVCRAGTAHSFASRTSFHLVRLTFFLALLPAGVRSDCGIPLRAPLVAPWLLPPPRPSTYASVRNPPEPFHMPCSCPSSSARRPVSKRRPPVSLHAPLFASRTRTSHLSGGRGVRAWGGAFQPRHARQPHISGRHSASWPATVGADGCLAPVAQPTCSTTTCGMHTNTSCRATTTSRHLTTCTVI
jgi:hypothetical protein